MCLLSSYKHSPEGGTPEGVVVKEEHQKGRKSVLTSWPIQLPERGWGMPRLNHSLLFQLARSLPLQGLFSVLESTLFYLLLLGGSYMIQFSRMLFSQDILYQVN